MTIRKKMNKIKNNFFGVCLTLLWLVVLVNSEFLGKVEGYLLPVISEATVTSYRETPEGVYLTGTYQKVRNCEFVDMDVVVYDGVGNGSRIDLIMPGRNKVRNVGTVTFENYFVATSMEDLAKSSFVFAHSCHPPSAPLSRDVKSVVQLDFE